MQIDPTFLETDSDDENASDADTDDATNDAAAAAGEVAPAPGAADDKATADGSADVSSSGATSAEGRRADAAAPLSGTKHKLGEGAGSDSCAHVDKQPRRNHKKLHDLSNVSSVGITARGPLDEHRFNMFMRDLLAEKARDIFRCKVRMQACAHSSPVT